ncbi:MAG: triple tyrosine motif-containing protein, partial [Candidatus Latescibacterota bacterium]
KPNNIRHYWANEEDSTAYIGGYVSSILFASDGAVWVGTTGAPTRLDPASGRFERFYHDPTDTTTISGNYTNFLAERELEPGVIWIGTGSGLNRYDPATGQFTHWTDKDGLPDNTVYAILVDGQGNLWMSTNNGISRFTPETGEFRNYGLEIGLQSLEFNQGVADKGPYGEMFFGGINGMNAFFPNELVENSVAPIVSLTDFRIANHRVTPGPEAPLQEPVGRADEIRLDHDQKDIAFDFVALHFMNPEKNQYAYQLEGYDDDWIEAGNTRTASYTNVPPGEYTFKVKAANADGVWNDQGASIRVVVDPPFWATWWFRILAVVGFAGVLYAGYSARVRQVEARSKELEQEVEKATSELRKSHEAIEASNEQLEQSYTIVEAINQETSFRSLLTKILEEARVIPGVEKATALVYMPDEDIYRFRASAGWDVWSLVDITLTEEEAEARYIDHADEVAPDIFVTKDARKLPKYEEFGEFGDVASFLVLRIEVDDQVVGYFVFDNLTDEDAFDERDVQLLNRLKEHITSAFIKTRLLDDLQLQRTDLQKTLDELRSTQDRLIQSEKLASLGQLSAGIAHEIKNPLNFVNNFSEVSTELLDDLESELADPESGLTEARRTQITAILNDLRMTAEKVAQHGKRADSIVQNMIRHSEGGEGQVEETDLNDLLDEYVNLAYAAFQSQNEGFEVEIERDFHDALGDVKIVPQDMGKVFQNLLGNALDALKEHAASNGSDFQPRLVVGTERRKRSVEIKITDNGPGIPPEVKSKIFEPFYTTKPTGSGTGLGLSMSYDIVTKGHGGQLEVVSEPGQGATFIVKLPA